MIVETIIVSTTVVILGSLRFVDNIHKRESSFQQKQFDEMNLQSPEICRAKRNAIAQKRETILQERDIYLKYWEKSSSDVNWNGLIRKNKELRELAEEESSIPLFEENGK